MAEPRVAGADLRRSLALVRWAWVFGAVWLYLTTGATLTQFAKLLDLPPFGFGLLAALPFFGALFQLPASWFIERTGTRKKFFIYAGIIHRGLWIVVAAIPWICPASLRWPAMVAVIALSWIAGQIIGPAWVSWMADLVPGQIRGRYFSRRSQMGAAVGLIVTVAIGWLLDRATAAGAETLLRTVASALALAAAAGISDFLFFTPVPDVRAKAPNPAADWREMWREPWRDRNFRQFVAWTATLTFATGFVSQFTWLYVLDVAGWTNAEANARLVLMPLLVVMICGPIWGRVVDRYGRKPVLLSAGAFLIPGSAAWILVNSDHWVAGYFIVIIATMAWPGVEHANFNLLLAMNDAKRESQGAYVAVNSTINALAGIASGIFGGVMAQALKGWHADIFGWPLTYHCVLFLTSSILRFTAWLWLLGLTDPQAGDTRMALRYFGTNLYSNVQQAVFIPGRVLQQISRWTFSIRQRRD